jgi:HK97 family phage portal protein
MKLFPRFGKKSNIVLEKKYYNQYKLIELEPAKKLQGTPSQFFEYYKLIHPLQTGIEYIIQGMQTIPLKLYDTQKQEYILQHPFLDLLKQPNPYQTGKQFLNTFIRHYILTGNSYCFVSGENLVAPPPALYLYNPSCITVQDNSTGKPREYQVTSASNIQTFSNTATERGIFYNEKGQLLHMRFFNPTQGQELLYGVSLLEATQEQLETYSQVYKNNRKLLENGLRASGILHYEGEIDDEGQTALERNIKNNLAGSGNAGKTMLSTGNTKLQYQQLSQNPKDMDFDKLLDNCTKAIYNALKIPTDLIYGQSTFNNQQMAQVSFYDNAVIPLTNNLFDFLTRNILKPRYKDADNLELRVDDSEISVLRQRQINNAVELYKAGILTLNKTLSKIGEEADAENGDTYYRPQNLVPIGNDIDTSDNRKKPVKKSVSNEFIQTLKDAGYDQKTIDDIIATQDEQY